MNPVFQEFHKILENMMTSKEYYTSEAFYYFPYPVLGLYLEKSGPRIWYINPSFLQLIGIPEATIKTGIPASRFFKTLTKKNMEEAGILEFNKCVTFETILKMKNEGILETFVTGKTLMIEGQSSPHFLGAMFQPKDIETNEETTLAAVKKFRSSPQFGSIEILKAAHVINETTNSLRQITSKWSEHFKQLSEPDFDSHEDNDARTQR